MPSIKSSARDADLVDELVANRKILNLAKQLANPRLIDVFGVDFRQEDVDFAIPRLHSDIPLYVDPFLLWISSNPTYRALHEQIIGFFRLVSECVRTDHPEAAVELLAGCEELRSMGLGYASGSRRGSNIGPKLIASIVRTHCAIPQLRDGRIRHIEELQLVVPNFAEDRLSDTATSILKPFFLEYTAQQCQRYKIPVRNTRFGSVYDSSRSLWIPMPELALPYNPVDDSPVLFVPLDMLRRLPWINYNDYYRSSFSPRVLEPKRRQRVAKEAVLAFNARKLH